MKFATLDFIIIIIIADKTCVKSDHTHNLPPLSSAGWSFGLIEGAAKYPHDSRAASGIFAHFFLRLTVSAQTNPEALTQCLSTVYQNWDVR